MKWNFWIQEKLYCTHQEVRLILGLVAIIVASHGIQIYRAGVLPFDDAYYAKTDSLFQYLAARADSLEAVDTVFTGPKYYTRYAKTASLLDSTTGFNFSGGFQQVGKSPLDDAGHESPIVRELSRWIVRDTVEKPTVVFPLNINSASEIELQALPRIGPQMARRIIEFRTQFPFKTIDQLTDVKGIGEKTLEKLRLLVTVIPDSIRLKSETATPDTLR